jgi:hypothetical protein
MKAKRDAGLIIIKHRTPDEPVGDESNPDSETAELEECMEDFKRAWNAGDMKRCAQILKMAHDTLHEYMNEENQPEEGNDGQS